MTKYAAIVPEYLYGYIKRANREGIRFEVGNYHFSSAGGVIYMGRDLDNPKKEVEISFCHEWGHARLWIQKKSPFREYFGDEGVHLDFDRMDSEAKTVILREEALAWQEAFKLVEKVEREHKRIMVECYTSYLRALSIPSREDRLWMFLLPK